MVGPSSRRASANGCSARGLLGELSGTVHVGMGRDRWCRDADRRSPQNPMAPGNAGSPAVLRCLEAASQWTAGEPQDRGLAIGNPLAPLATVPAALVLAGSALAAMATPAKKAAPRAVDLQRVSM